MFSLELPVLQDEFQIWRPVFLLAYPLLTGEKQMKNLRLEFQPKPRTD